MSKFNFPFTDFHDLNFDWMLKCWRDIYDKIPTKLSQLLNDKGFVNRGEAAAAAPVQSVNGQTGDVVIPDELFICTYGITTNADIEQAIADDLLICCGYNDRYYTLTHRDSATKHIFNIIENTSTGPHSYWLICDSDTWSNSSMLLAKNASPALTGTPTAPTAATGTNTQQIATTAFVQQELLAGKELYWCTYGTTTNAEIEAALAADKLPLVILGGNIYFLNFHPNATTHRFTCLYNIEVKFISCVSNSWSAGTAILAPRDNPTLGGVPKAPTATAGDNSTQIATTAFVQGEIADLAPLEDPALTGTPTAPTAAPGDNSTQIATTAFVQAAMGEYITLLGDKANINPVDDLDDFVTGIGLFINNAQTPIANFPWAAPIDCALVFSAGETGIGIVQYAIPSTNTEPAMMRIGGGSWTMACNKVQSVNGMYGAVVLDADDVGAIPAGTGIITDEISGTSVTVSGLSYATATIDVSKTGYTPIGIIGIETGNTSISISEYYISGNNAILETFNKSNSSKTFTPKVHVLYLKN